jgi:1-acyl-sn-glycerol-3-phosphate acyltransferase
VVNWTNLKTLATEDPVQAFERRNPDFFKRYVGRQDRYGFDMQTFAAWEPFFRFCFEEYFKVEVQGLHNIPNEGRCILVGNHSGTLPIDGGMLAVAMLNLHPSPRRIRFLVTDWFFHLPFIGEWMTSVGQVRGTLPNAQRLLADDEIIGIYPEGVRGVGKIWRDRYRLVDFHPGFIKLAIATQTPLVPIAALGGDEVFPMLANVRELASFMRMPYFPVTATFPWLPFPWWMMPLPVRWMIRVHEPFNLDYPPEKANDKKLVRKLCREVQYIIQKDLNQLFDQRKTLFTGWDLDQPEEGNGSV